MSGAPRRSTRTRRGRSSAASHMSRRSCWTNIWLNITFAGPLFLAAQREWLAAVCLANLRDGVAPDCLECLVCELRVRSRSRVAV